MSLSRGRTRIGAIVARVYGSCFERLMDEKNVAKGDSWRDMGWLELADMLEEESREMREEAMLGNHEGAVREAGDVLAVVAFMLDKCGER